MELIRIFWLKIDSCFDLLPENYPLRPNPSIARAIHPGMGEAGPVSEGAASELQVVPSGMDLHPVEPLNIVAFRLLPDQNQGLGIHSDRANAHTTTYHAPWLVINLGDFEIWSHCLCCNEFIATPENPTPFTPKASILAGNMSLGKTSRPLHPLLPLEASKKYEAHHATSDFK
ncbi:hypothetical protein DFH28DRAFT_1123905 [Melampsora americana]|nr:hypothetical protein DFH28DRAFT_1123905 [Melampsora americana]